MKKKLTKSCEIECLIPVGPNYDFSKICLFIPIAENEIFKCLGKDLFNDFCNSLNPVFYSSYKLAEKWNENKQYSVDDFVISDGLLYKSLINGNTNEPDLVSWEQVPKFLNPYYNELWYCGLGDLIGWLSLYHSLPTTWVQNTNSGLTKAKTEFVESAEIGDVKVLRSSYKKGIETYWEKIKDELKNKEHFPLYPPNQSECSTDADCEVKPRKHSGFAFLNENKSNKNGCNGCN